MTTTEGPSGLPSNNAKYVIVALVLGLGIIGVLAFKFCNESAPIPEVAKPPAAVTTPPPPVSVALPDSPPDDDAGGDASVAHKNVSSIGPGPVVNTCSGKCEGAATAELTSALNGRAAQARGCYNQALNADSNLSGNVNVALRVGPTGQLCGGPSVTNAMNGPGGMAVASCVQRVLSVNYPPPKGGCVDTSFTLHFSTPGH